MQGCMLDLVYLGDQQQMSGAVAFQRSMVQQLVWYPHGSRTLFIGSAGTASSHAPV